MASLVLVQSCGTGTTGGETELAAVLDGAADREGVAHGECRDGCAAEGLAVFDECTADGKHREACFGRAIHSFYECGGKCEPATCEDECQARVTEEFAECIELTGNEEACRIESREFLSLCIDEFCDEPEPDPDPEPDPEPPTCEDRCGKFAEHVYEACMSKIDSEERCAAIAHHVQEHCTDRCEGRPCDCDRDCGCDDDDGDSDSDSDSDSDRDCDSDCDCDDDCGCDSDKYKDKH